MEAVQKLALEWVLLNGSLPGFDGRVQSSLSSWPKTTDNLVVYRAQGHSLPGIPRVGDARTLVPGLRSVLATSVSPDSVVKYAGGDCCIFQITLPVGTPYIDTPTVLSDVSDALLIEVRDAAAASGLKFPPATISANSLRGIIAKRIMAEKEIMIPGNGTFSPPVDISPINGKTTVALTYTPPALGGRRGRTFRRKPKRSNKNGSRLARKSKHHVKRNSHA